jgi:hypothetical protein
MTKPISLFNRQAPRTFWSQHREASLNWLALGMLLAAWNASDNEAAETAHRPDELRHHAFVSVRAAQRLAQSAEYPSSTRSGANASYNRVL